MGRILSLRPLGYVGDRSYAFYLWHWPVLIIAAQYAGHELSLGARLLLLCGAFGLSIVSYRLVEDPLRRMRWPTPVGALSWPASAAAVLAVALVILGSLDKTARRFEAAAAAVRPLALVDTAAAANLERVPFAAASARRGRRQSGGATRPRSRGRSRRPSAASATTSTASRTVARRGDGRRGAGSAGSATPAARRRSSSSATRTRRCGCPRS